MAPEQTTHFHTISNPNTNALMSILHGALQTKTSTAVGFKMIEDGMDKLPVIILEMNSINRKTWKKRLVLIVFPTP